MATPTQHPEIKAILPTVPVEIRAAESTAEGAAKPRTFTLTAYTGQPIRQWWEDRPIVVDVSTMDLSQQEIPALCDHAAIASHVVGQVQSISRNASTVTASGVFTVTDEPDDQARMVLAKADAGYKWQASIRGPASTMEEVAAGEKVTINGQEFTGPLLIARGVRLQEVSFVVLGADNRTSAVVASESIPGGKMEEQINQVVATGETVAETSTETNTTETVAVPETPVETPELTPEAAAVTLPNTVTASRPPAGVPNAIVRNAPQGDALQQVLAAAMILRCGGTLDHPAYNTPNARHMDLPRFLRAGINDPSRNRTMDQAYRYMQLSMLDMCRHSLRASGREIPFDNRDCIRAAFSSGSLTNSMTTSMNALLYASFAETMDSTEGWVAETTINNYLTNERVSLVNSDALTLHPKDTAADHVTVTDVAETYKGYRFSRQMMIDEIDIINDTVGAVAEKVSQFGPMCRRLKPDLVYGTLLANATLNATSRALFNSTDANLITSSALSKATLITALARMRSIAEGGVNLMIRPTHLVVPEDLYPLAAQLCMSLTETSGNTTGQGTLNPISLYGVKPVSDPRLNNGLTHPVTGTAYSGSATTWFLVSGDNPAIEIGYVMGRRVPRIETYRHNGQEGKYGVGWTVTMDEGVCARGWKGLQKQTA